MQAIKYLTGALFLQIVCLLTTTSILHADEREAVPRLKLVEFASGIDNPVAITHAGDGSGRLFVTGQKGMVYIIRDGTVLQTPFLDIHKQVSCCGEQGLLSIAFHPDYKNNGTFYVNYTNRKDDTVVSKFHVSKHPDRADPDSEKQVILIKQEERIHNGGQIQFGPDGYLYIGTGDGGSFPSNMNGDSGGDPFNHAQDLASLLGKILRIDVDSGDPYSIPPGNPFAGNKEAAPEIWATGLRNPWRFSFDRSTGDLFIGDVGEQQVEEVNFLAAGDNGANFGWRRMEGELCFKPSYKCNDGSLVLPVISYHHDYGCAVIGGYRYRGKRYPDLTGIYLYADFCTRKIFAAVQKEKGSWESAVAGKSSHPVTAFGEDENGELYLTVFTEESGMVYVIEIGDE
jgi:glucose/arabinose dehydrogenase